jgi:hypothetical protein
MGALGRAAGCAGLFAALPVCMHPEGEKASLLNGVRPLYSTMPATYLQMARKLLSYLLSANWLKDLALRLMYIFS